MNSEQALTRIGIGFDTHPFEADQPLILGGVKIPFALGLSGYSDADVLTHAVIDALLGAARMGDIGEHFPEDDERFKNISSLSLLAETKKILDESGYTIINIDSVLILEAPRLRDYRKQMISNLAQTLSLDEENVSIKAKTTEGLGFTGRGEGIAAQAVVLIARK